MTAIQTFTIPVEEDELPAAKGAYGLLIRLPRRFRGPVGALGQIDLAAGTYLYLGSAYGPGGLRARLTRHLRASKKAHWHVDYLTGAGDITDVVALPEGRECELVDRALGCPGVFVPVPGFGSSDCARCPAHLLAVSTATRSIITTLVDMAGRS